jgi:peptidoglycan hydrolase-like protein with peptidoglycan-binding domain
MTILNFKDFLAEAASSDLYAIGATGEEVKKIQQKLIDLGFLKIAAPTGNYQEQTKKAVEDFQRSKGLTGKDVDGIIGPKTYPLLMASGQKPRGGQMQISDTLAKLNIKFDPTQQHDVFKCTETGCAQWVSDSLAELGVNRQGNAWHAVKVDQQAVEFTVFKNFSKPMLAQMASLFAKINKLAPKEGTYEAETKKLVEQLIPDQAPLKSMLNVNDIVGLYYSGSHNFTKAFYEGATGYGKDNAGNFVKMTDGPYFVKNDGSAWTTADMGKDSQFKPGNTLNSGGGFAFNTHLGYVGAIVDGEPIIFHSINQTVYSTPFSSAKDIKVLWIKSGEKSSSTGLKKVEKGFIDKFKDLFF